tara:strand:- start:1148 stop:1339 length:192 start_codon:yes stop_codon:yes gene_type:complete
MDNNEKFLDSKMIANFVIAFALLFATIYYFNYSDEIEGEVNTVIVNSLIDVNNSLAEHETAGK